MWVLVLEQIVGILITINYSICVSQSQSNHLIMGRSKIDRVAVPGQSRGVNGSKVKRAMNEKHVSVISLPFKAEAGSLTGNNNTMELFKVKNSDIFSWAPRIGTTLKYNNARLIKMEMRSISTASLTTNGTHALWASFDQQSGSFPASGAVAANDAAIMQVLSEMQQTGQYKIGSAITRLEDKVTIPSGIRSFNFQDVATTATDEGYNPTVVTQLIRIFPKTAVPITNVDITVEFSGLGPAGTAVTTPEIPAEFDTEYDARFLTINWLKYAFNELQRGLPLEDGSGKIAWEPSLFVVTISDNGRKMYLWQTVDDVVLNASWKAVFFPKRHPGGKLSSELTELCYFKVTDRRLDVNEIYYAHAPEESWEFDPWQIAAGLYIRSDNNRPVGERTADEILASVVANHGLNVNLGQNIGGD
nr:hypothetical protein [Hepelivirales sp.]